MLGTPNAKGFHRMLKVGWSTLNRRLSNRPRKKEVVQLNSGDTIHDLTELFMTTLSGHRLECISLADVWRKASPLHN